MLSCILCGSIGIEIIVYPRLTVLREEIISHFFEALTLRSEAIVVVAKKVLEQVPRVFGSSVATLSAYDVDQVLTNPANAPRELLKNSLRPILQSLGEVKRLSVPLLEGLGRLLLLLRQYFNEVLGDKLLNLLTQWTKPETAASRVRDQFLNH